MKQESSIHQDNEGNLAHKNSWNQFFDVYAIKMRFNIITISHIAQIKEETGKRLSSSIKKIHTFTYQTKIHTKTLIPVTINGPKP